MSQILFLDTVLTRSVGRRDSPKDSVFNDVDLYGEYPDDPKIKGIKQIDVFSDRKAGDKAVITGLTIIYDGADDPVSHGIVVNVNNVGTVTIEPANELLFAIYGRLKDVSGGRNDERIASIGFVVFNEHTGKTRAEGPFQGTIECQGTPWITIGPVVALHGTTKDGIGLTTLGFVKHSRQGRKGIHNGNEHDGLEGADIL